MTGSSLKDTWARGETTYGAWLLTCDTLVARTAASLDFDYVGIDVQHGTASADSSADAIAAMVDRTVPLVRVAQNNPAEIGRQLDAGALGIIVPLVETADEAQAAVAACRYPPEGHRSFGPARARLAHGADYATRANDLVTCIPMIETALGLENVDEIAAVPGVDALYVGPADLSLNLGLPPLLDQDDREFAEALRTIATAARRHGVAAGVHASAALADRRREQGFAMITVAVDQTLLADAMRGALDTARTTRS